MRFYFRLVHQQNLSNLTDMVQISIFPIILFRNRFPDDDKQQYFRVSREIPKILLETKRNITLDESCNKGEKNIFLSFDSIHLPWCMFQCRFICQQVALVLTS